MTFVEMIILLLSLIQVSTKTNIAFECIEQDVRKELIVFLTCCKPECQTSHYVDLWECISDGDAYESHLFSPDGIPLKGCLFVLKGANNDRFSKKVLNIPMIELITYEGHNLMKEGAHISSIRLNFNHMDWRQDSQLCRIQVKTWVWNYLEIFLRLISTNKHRLFSQRERIKMFIERKRKTLLKDDFLEELGEDMNLLIL